MTEDEKTPDEVAEEAAEVAEAAAADAEQAETPAEAAEAAAVAAEAAEVAADAAAEAEEKPAKKRASRRKKADADAATDEEADEAEEAEAAQEEKPAAKKRGPRRGSAEAGAKKRASRRPKTTETIYVRAQAKYVRSSPRKARLVVDHIRGKSVEEARAILAHTPRAAAVPVLKVLESAIANAEHNHELLPEELSIHQVMVDEGPTIKRFRPRALGRATKIRKRTSHITINLTNKA
jgi:ribosomal protein L22